MGRREREKRQKRETDLLLLLHILHILLLSLGSVTARGIRFDSRQCCGGDGVPPVWRLEPKRCLEAQKLERNLSRRPLGRARGVFSAVGVMPALLTRQQQERIDT